MSAIRKGTADTVSDDMLLPPDDASMSILADMKAALSEEVKDTILDLPVPNRPNLFVRYNATFEFDKLNHWMKSARKGKTTDPKKLAWIVLHATCVGTGVVKEIDGEMQNIEYIIDGQSQTFDSKSIQDMLGTMAGWSGAIDRMYANDGHQLQTMNRIITEAGYSEMDLDDLDSYDPLGR